MDFPELSTRLRPVLDALTPVLQISEEANRQTLLDSLMGLGEVKDRKDFLTRLMELEARNRAHGHTMNARYFERVNDLIERHSEGQDEAIQHVLSQVRATMTVKPSASIYANALGRGISDCVAAEEGAGFAAARQAVLRDAMQAGLDEVRGTTEKFNNMLPELERNFLGAKSDCGPDDWPMISPMMSAAIALSTLAGLEARSAIGLQAASFLDRFREKMDEVPLHLLDGIIRDNLGELKAELGLDEETPAP